MRGKGFLRMGRWIGRVGVFLCLGLFVEGTDAGSGENAPVAGHADLRPAFKKWGLGARFQGDRNTCSVFVLTGALEYARARREDRATTLSVEFLNWAANKVEAEKDDGAFFSDLWKGFSVYGICPEPQMPYQTEFDPDRAPGPDVKEQARQALETGYRLHWIKPWNPKTGLSEPELERIKRTLDRQWPVCGGFRWPLHPVHEEGDILNTPPPEGVKAGHSVLLVGYRDDPRQPGGGTFLFRNTNHYGREGRMTYAYAAVYMNDAAWVDFETP
jgi:hypothetical protein